MAVAPPAALLTHAYHRLGNGRALQQRMAEGGEAALDGSHRLESEQRRRNLVLHEESHHGLQRYACNRVGAAYHRVGSCLAAVLWRQHGRAKESASSARAHQELRSALMFLFPALCALAPARPLPHGHLHATPPLSVASRHDDLLALSTSSNHPSVWRRVTTTSGVKHFVKLTRDEKIRTVVGCKMDANENKKKFCLLRFVPRLQ